MNSDNPREDYYANPIEANNPPNLKRNAETVVMVVRERDLMEDGGVYRLRSKPLLNRKFFPNSTLADSFPFREHLSCYHLGSGFFIRQNVIATAAHILFPSHEAVNLSEVRFIRGLYTDEAFDTISPLQIFKPVQHQLQAGQYRISQSGADWALIPVESITGGAVAVDLPELDLQDVNRGEAIYCIGHGLGMKMKANINFRSIVISSNISQPYFECNLPPFVVSSGAPVFYANSHQLVGMLIRGRNQFFLENSTVDIRSIEPRWEGEECQRLTPLWAALIQG